MPWTPAASKALRQLVGWRPRGAEIADAADVEDLFLAAVGDAGDAQGAAVGADEGGGFALVQGFAAAHGRGEG